MIEVRHLSKRFSSLVAVDDISFQVKTGEIFVLLGTSGCGKTTTLKMINRLVIPDAGEVWINGKPSTEEPAQKWRRAIGYVMQDIGLFPHYTVAENAAVVPDLLKWDKAKTRARTEVLLQKFNLPPATYLSLYPDQLSGGQRQRAGFVRALMANPPIILMDEPLGALDPVTRHQIRREFKLLDELKGKTILLVTHDIPEAFALGDRIGLMHEGKIQQIGTAADLMLHPENSVVKNFFSQDKFLLQWSALKVKDILATLPVVKTKLPGDRILASESTLLDALEQLVDYPGPESRLVINDGQKKPSYQLRIGELLNAFHQKTNHT